jgi:hypothetical protein
MLKGKMNGQLLWPFRAMPEMEHAFRRLQQAFTTTLVVVHFDLDKPFLLETGYSCFAMAWTLFQLVDQAHPKVPETVLT